MNAEVVAIIDNTGFTAAQINQRLDWAYDYVADAKDWKVLQVEDTTTTLATGQKDYDVPTALKSVEYVWMVDESTGTLDYDGQTANFTVGATLSGATGGGVIDADSDSGTTGTLTLSSITTGFVDGETITDNNGTPGSAAVDGQLTIGVSKVRLTPEDLEEYIDNYRHLTTGNQTPRCWSMVGNKVRLNSGCDTSSKGFKLYMIGHSSVTVFAGDSSVTALDRRLDKAVIQKAAAYCFRDLLMESDDANYYDNLTEDSISDVFGSEIAYSQL